MICRTSVCVALMTMKNGMVSLTEQQICRYASCFWNCIIQKMCIAYTFGHFPQYGTTSPGPGIHICEDHPEKEEIKAILPMSFLSLPSTAAPSCLLTSYSHTCLWTHESAQDQSWLVVWSHTVQILWSKKSPTSLIWWPTCFSWMWNAGRFHQIVHSFYRPEPIWSVMSWLSGHNICICMVPCLCSSFEVWSCKYFSI